MNRNENLWAFIYAITLAVIVAIVGYVVQRPQTAQDAMFRIAESLISGALGFFAGRFSKAFENGMTPPATPNGDDPK